MFTQITLSKFYMDCMLTARKNHWRYGQACFNSLNDIRPDLANKVLASDMDPFHMDGPEDNYEMWDKFATFIEMNWYKEF